MMESDVDRLMRGSVVGLTEPSDNTFWLYVVSTNNDMETEKHVLYREVFPQIRKRCEEKGLILQVVEIPDEAHYQPHRKVRRSRSAGQCVLALLGEKRCPKTLPYTINAKEFRVLIRTGERILEGSEQKDESGILDNLKSTLAFLIQNYKNDLNSVPPCFVLQPDYTSSLTADRKADDVLTLEKVTVCLQKLAKAANAAKNLSTRSIFKYCYPALNTTIDYLKEAIGPATRGTIITIKRHFQDFQLERGHNLQSAQTFFDLLNTHETFVWDDEGHSFLNKLEKNLDRAGPFLFYSVDWSENGVNVKSEKHLQYLERMKDGVNHKMREILNKIKREEADNQISHDSLAEEIRFHSQINANIVSSFCGLDDMSTKIQNHLKNQPLKLILYGDPGSGKTFLCGKLIQTFRELHGASSVQLFRFLQPCGTINHECHIFNSLCEQVYRIVEKQNSKVRQTKPSSLLCTQEKIEYLLNLLSSCSSQCLIVLDGVENICQPELLFTSFLENLPTNISYVISTSSDSILSKWVSLSTFQTDQCQSKVNFCDIFEHMQKSFYSQESTTPFVAVVPPYSSPANVLAINKVLANNQRCLTAYQKDQVMTVWSKFQNPLFTELLVKEASRWPSYGDSNQWEKEPTLLNLLDTFFTLTEEFHDEGFVVPAVAYITLSRSGISQSELLNILSLDPGMKVRELPFALGKLLDNLDHLLSEKQYGHSVILTWSHSIFSEFFKEKYLSKSTHKFHRVLANYWVSLYERYGSNFTTDEEDCSSVEQITKSRVFEEIPYHLISSNDKDKADEFLLNPGWMFSKVKTVSPSSVLQDFQQASQIWPNCGYGLVSESFALSESYSERNFFMKELLEYLQPYSQTFPDTVGKLCNRIVETLLKQIENSFVMCIGQGSNPGPLIKRWKYKDAELAISTDTNELLSLTNRGFLVCYDLATAAVKRVRRLCQLPMSDNRMAVHQKTDGRHILAIYGSIEVCLFDLDSLECVKTVPYVEGSINWLSPNADCLLSVTSSKGFAVRAVSGGDIIFNSLSETRSEQRYLLFSEDDEYLIFQETKFLRDTTRQTVIKALNTKTQTETSLSEMILPETFQVKVCFYKKRCVAIGAVKVKGDTNAVAAEDFDMLLHVKFFELPKGSCILIIQLPAVSSYLFCDSRGEQFISGNEEKGFVYALPQGNLVCEMNSMGSKDAIINGEMVIYYGNSSVTVCSSTSGNILAQWSSFGKGDNDRYYLNSDCNLLVQHSTLAGMVHVWRIPPKTPNQGNTSDLTFSCMAYDESSGQVFGVTAQGRIATMNTCMKVLQWRYLTMRVSHTGDKLVLSKDGSLLIVLGTGLSVFHIGNEKKLFTKDTLSSIPNFGRFTDAGISVDNQLITVTENVAHSGAVLHILQLNDSTTCTGTYNCAPGRTLFGRRVTLFLREKEHTNESFDNTTKSLEIFLLKHKKDPQRILSERRIDKSSVVSINPNETALALINIQPSDEQNLSSLTVSVFDLEEQAFSGEYTSEPFLDIVLKEVLFSISYIIVFCSQFTIKLDLKSGIFRVISTTGLQNPRLSKDEKFVVAQSPMGDVHLLNVETSEILAKYTLSQNLLVPFMSSPNLDKLFFFQRGMCYPLVLIANGPLRDSMHLDKTSIEIPHLVKPLDTRGDVSNDEWYKPSIKSQDNTANNAFPESEVCNNAVLSKNESLKKRAFFFKNRSSANHLNQVIPDSIHNVRDVNISLPQGSWSSEPQTIYQPNTICDSDSRTLASQFGNKDTRNSDESSSGSYTDSGSSDSYTTSDSGSSGTYSGDSSSSYDSSSATDSDGPDSTNFPAKKNMAETTPGEKCMVTASQTHESASKDPDVSIPPKQLRDEYLDAPVLVNADSSDVSGIAPKLAKQQVSCNYFASSESEEEYDGGVEDNTFSGDETFSGFKTSNDNQGDWNVTQNPITTSPESDESEQYKSAIHIAPTSELIRRPVLIHRPTTCNYFLSDDEDDDPPALTNEKGISRDEAGAPQEPWPSFDSSNDCDETSGSEIPGSSSSSIQKQSTHQQRVLMSKPEEAEQQNNPSKTCVLM